MLIKSLQKNVLIVTQCNVKSTCRKVFGPQEVPKLGKLTIFKNLKAINNFVFDHVQFEIWALPEVKNEL